VKKIVGTSGDVAERKTAHSTIPARLEDSATSAAKAALEPAHSVVTTMAARAAAFPRAASPASAASAEAAASTVAAGAAGIIANLNPRVAIALSRYRNYL